MTDLTQKQNVVDLMKSSRSKSEWNNNCDAVKAANNGYPSWWYAEIVLSGVSQLTQMKW